MKLLEISAKLLNSPDLSDPESKKRYTNKIKKIFDDFYKEQNNQTYFFISEILADTVQGALITENPDFCIQGEDNIEKYCLPWEDIGLSVKDVTVKEISSQEFAMHLNLAQCYDFIDRYRNITDRFGISGLFTVDGGFLSNSDGYIEKLLDAQQSRDEMMEKAKKILWDMSLKPELDRIYIQPKTAGPYGHPVHYLLFGDNLEDRENAMDILLSALYQNHRLKQKRYCQIAISHLSIRETRYLEKLYNCYVGGAIVLRYRKSSRNEEDIADVSLELISKFCELIKKHSNDVLTFLCFPLSCTEEKKQFFEYLQNFSFVALEEGMVNRDLACKYLENRACENNHVSLNGLFNMVSEERVYHASELKSIFNEWSSGYMKTTVYPQYCNILTIQKEIAEKKPDGNAYEKLQVMVGLDEVKKVIQSVLDYFKALMIFKKRIPESPSPSMHMVFTGNPGTAKTTVARHFSHIMHDNCILSSGHIVEVGRGDLVGKYLGWTAQIVKKKFDEARGGVLFIDEAYSLVDDRAGLFGDEAINTIVQEMENHREDLVVIFAGYPDKMEEFLKRNPGLRSRIAFHIHFDDYTTEELCEIAERMAREQNLHFDICVREKLYRFFSQAIKTPDFGNGRFVRNILEKAKMKQASRLIQCDVDRLTDKELTVLTAEDFEIELPETQKVCVKIGF